jgi:hypothetical protein
MSPVESQQQTKYRPLPEQFRKNGYNHRILRRVEDVVLIHKTQGLWEGWEVACVQRHGSYQLNGTTIEAAEHMPSPEQWGTYAWSYMRISDAERRFNAQVLNGVFA